MAEMWQKIGIKEGMQVSIVLYVLDERKVKSYPVACLYILLLIAAFLLTGCTKSEDLRPIDYRKELNVLVEWGARAGKFGLAVPAEGEIVGPRTFAIDDEGGIHILDSVKKNIKVFSRAGAFLGSIGKDVPGYSIVVHKGHYYLLDGEYVHQYSLSGTKETVYPIAEALDLHEGYGQWMYIDYTGNLYVRSRGRTYLIREDSGVKNAVLSEEKQIESERRGAPNASGNRWFAFSRVDFKHFKLRTYDKNGNLLNEFPVETKDVFGHILFLGEDKNGIIYLEVGRVDENDKVHLEIRMYHKDGRLAQSMDLPDRYYTIVYKKTAVDKDGKIYQMQTLPSGVRIERWGG